MWLRRGVCIFFPEFPSGMCHHTSGQIPKDAPVEIGVIWGYDATKADRVAGGNLKLPLR